MEKHRKIYFDFFGYDEGKVCEMCPNFMTDVHHIAMRSKTFGPKRDQIENLIGLCRSCHRRSHNVEQPELTAEELSKRHEWIIFISCLNHGIN